jgi:DNA-binding transcriptional ArsR family regulator
MPRFVPKEFALANELRVKMLGIVGDHPGINMTHLAEQLGCKPSTVIWHASKLEGADLLRSQRSGYFRIFYLLRGADDPQMGRARQT